MSNQVSAPGRQTLIDPRREAKVIAAGRVFRWAAVGYAILGIIGLFIPAARGIPPGPAGLRDLTAPAAIGLAVVAIGSLLSGETSPTISTRASTRRMGLAFSLGGGLFGLFIVLIFVYDGTGIWRAWPDIPAVSVGVTLTVLGAAVPLSIHRSETRVVAGQVCALLVFSLAAMIGLGYLHGDRSEPFLWPAISFHTVLTGVLVATGVFLMRPGSGLLSVASSPGSGGRVLRWLGPLVLLTPAGLLFLIESDPFNDRVDLVALLSVGVGLFLMLSLAVFVKALDETAMRAATSAAQAERARIGLEQEAPVVSRLSKMLHLAEVDSDHDSWEVATRYRPGHGSVAGDASLVRTIGAGRIGAVLVDVTGHGEEPAILALRVRDLLAQSLVIGLTPAQALNSVSWSTPGDVLASAIVVTISQEDGSGLLCSAGHPPAILVGMQDAVLIEPSGPLLYLEPSAEYSDQEFTMGPGSELVLFSDGVGDVQRMEEGRTEPELLSDLLLAGGGTATGTAELVLGFADPEPGDDQSVVVIRRLP